MEEDIQHQPLAARACVCVCVWARAHTYTHTQHQWKHTKGPGRQPSGRTSAVCLRPPDWFPALQESVGYFSFPSNQQVGVRASQETTSLSQWRLVPKMFLLTNAGPRTRFSLGLCPLTVDVQEGRGESNTDVFTVLTSKLKLIDLVTFG